MKKNPFLIMSNLINHSHDIHEFIDVINYLMLKENDEMLAKEKSYTKTFQLMEETDFLKTITNEIANYNYQLNDEQKQTLLNFIQKYNVSLLEEYVIFKNKEIYSKEKSLIKSMIKNQSLFETFSPILLNEPSKLNEFREYIYKNNVLGQLIDLNAVNSLMILKQFNFNINQVDENKNYPIFSLNNYATYEYLSKNFNVNWNVKDKNNQSIIQYIPNNKDNDLLIKNLLKQLKEDSSFEKELANKIIDSIESLNNKKDILKLLDSYPGDIRKIYSEEGNNLVMTCLKVKNYRLAHELYFQYKFDPIDTNCSNKNKTAMNYIISHDCNLPKTIAPKRDELIKSLLSANIVFDKIVKENLLAFISVNYTSYKNIDKFIPIQSIIDKIQEKYGSKFDTQIQTLKECESNKKTSYSYRKYWEEENIMALFALYEPLTNTFFENVLTQVEQLLLPNSFETENDELSIQQRAIQTLNLFLSDKSCYKLYQSSLENSSNQETIANIANKIAKLYDGLNPEVDIFNSQYIKLLDWMENLGSENLNDETVYHLTSIISKTGINDEKWKKFNIDLEKRLLTQKIESVNPATKKLKI